MGLAWPYYVGLGVAVAAYAADTWRGQPLESWGPQITYEEGPYSLDLLANADIGAGREGAAQAHRRATRSAEQVEYLHGILRWQAHLQSSTAYSTCPGTS